MATRDGFDLEEAREMIKLLADAQADMNCKSSNGYCPLHLLGNRPLAKFLIDLNADPRMVTEEQGPVVLSSSGHVDNLRAFVAAGVALDSKDAAEANPESGERLWFQALLAHSSEPLEMLLQSRIDVLAQRNEGNRRTPLHTACANWSPAVVSTLLNVALQDKLAELIFAQDQTGKTIIHDLLSCSIGDMVQVDAQMLTESDRLALAGTLPAEWPLKHVLQLLKQKFTESELRRLVNVPDKDMCTPLGLAKRWQQMQLLLEAGAEAKDSIAGLLDSHLWDLKVVDLLLEHKADINAMKEGRTDKRSGVRRLVQSGDVPLLKQWVRRGADLQILDVDGDPLLHYAPHQAMITYLVQQQADINRANQTTGDTLLHHVCKVGDMGLFWHIFDKMRAKPTSGAEPYFMLQQLRGISPSSELSSITGLT